MNWEPERLKVGDRVVYPQKKNWGEGVVLNEIGLGEIPLSDEERITYHPKTKGQRVSVKFEDGRTRTIITPKTSLKLLNRPTVEQGGVDNPSNAQK